MNGEPRPRNGKRAIAFSIVVPLFNKRAFVERALRSALAQTHDSFEIIVVDDGSTDGSGDLVSAIRDSRLKLVAQGNQGPGPARNRGIAEAAGEWIAFLDSDDLWFPDHLATLEQVSRQFPQAGVVASGFRRHPAGLPLPEPAPAAPCTPGELIDYFAHAARQEPLWTSCTAVRRTACLASGGFGTFWPGEDIDLWARLALDHPFAVSGRQTVLYLTGTGGLMDSWDKAPDRPFELEPVFTTLDAALRNPERAPMHGAIGAYRTALLEQRAVQALYRGRPDHARRFLGEITRTGASAPAGLRLLSRLPGRAVALGSRAYSLAKRTLRATFRGSAADTTSS